MASACRPNVEKKRVIVRDQGIVCFGPSVDPEAGAPPVDLVAGAPLPLTIRSMPLSDVCATERESKCSVKREGDRLVVNTEMSWIAPVELDRRCKGTASSLEARCTTDALPAGDYRLMLGADTVDIALPSHLDANCIGDPLARARGPALKPISAALSAAPPPVSTSAATALPPDVVPAAPGTGVAPTPPIGDTVCIGPATATKGRALKAGQPISITILHKNACIGSSCTLAPGKCTAKRKGQTIVVTPQFPSSTTKPARPCTEDCSAIAATCKSDPLPAGQYSVDIADRHRPLTVPAPAAPPCGN
jgi:hypothetical protein